MRILSLIAVFLILATKVFSAEVVSVSPEGSVKNIKQISVRFSTDMTPLGDPRDTINPFIPVCKDMKGVNINVPESQSRWADSKNWSFDYAKPLTSGVRCEFQMKANLKDLKGEAVKEKNFSFSTSGPSIVSSRPAYESIEPEQYFVLQLDGAVNEESVAKHAYFEVAGIVENVPVNIIKGKEREEILKSEFEELYKTDPKGMQENFLVIAAGRRFPELAKVKLHWTTGILSKTGIAVSDQQFKEFTVLAPFTATFSCERTDFGQPCSPISDMYIGFSRQVRFKELKNITLTSGKNKWTASEFSDADASSPEKMVYGLSFKGPFPEKSKFILNVPPGIKDDSGRDLVNVKEFPLTVSTDGYSPLIKFSARFGVVEWTTESMLPVSVRNIEKSMKINQQSFDGKSFNLSSMESAKEIINLYQRTMDKGEYISEGVDPRNKSVFISQGKEKPVVKFSLPKASGENDFEMMGIPLKNPGFHVVEVESPRLGKVLTLNKKPMYVATSVLVTNMGIHFKKGIESSLVWVTYLNTSKPVADAAISIRDCGGSEIAKGTTDKDGMLKLGELSSKEKTPCDEWQNHYYIFAKKGIDLSFMSTAWNQGIESWRYQVATDNSYVRKTWGSLIAHTVLDRTLFKPGETVQMKHILREHNQNGFTIAGPKVWPVTIVVRHSGSGKTYNLPVKIDPKTGTALNTFSITKEMEMGNYEISMSDKRPVAKPANEDDYGDDYDYDAKKTGSFIVSDFRLPLMAATVKIQGGTLVRTKNVKVDLSAHYLSGGPAAKLEVETRSQLNPSTFLPDFPGSEEYSFFSEPLKTGYVAKNSSTEAKAEDIRMKELVFDEKGGVLLEVGNLETGNIPKNLVVEMDYADPNGEVKTASGEKLIFPSKYIVGMRVDSWFGTAAKTKILGVVSDPDSKLIKNVKYTVEAFKRESYSHRKRLVGGFYSYDSKEEIKLLGVVCSGESDKDGRFECTPKDLPPGSIELQAKVVDDQSAATYAKLNINILKEGEESWWSSGDSDRIDILPSKKEFSPNETADFIVKTPFKDATVLVTVEREGVLDQFVTSLSRDNPVIKVPLKGSYAPNVFVSAVVVRGRVGEPKADFLVDLGKPVMKMGLSEIKVGWAAHKLSVNVSTDKKKYNVRDTATVKIKLETPDGSLMPKNTEVILVALDESLLLLRSNASFDLLAAMMTQRGHGVEASSNLNQVIGRRHFGLKAKPPGGGGGLMEGPREKFDPLLAFIPNLKVNDKGEVETKIKLNDSISSFRIVAIAHAGANLFGTGKVNIVTNKDIILYSGISPVARTGDKIDNVFTVRNASEKTMKIGVTAMVKGIEGLPALPNLELKPSESKMITLPITIPDKMKELEFLVSVKDLEGEAHDEIKVKESLSPSVPARILQATLFQLDKNFTVPVRQPADAIKGSGNVSVSSRATLVQGLGGIKRYMEEYPYDCLEQRTSKAIVLDDKKALQKIIQDMPGFMDGRGLLKFFDRPGMCGSPSMTRYILDILDENKYVIPTNDRNKIISGLIDALNGKFDCLPWWMDISKNKYSDEEKILFLQTLSRYKRFDVKVLESINITPNLWTTETLTNWIQLLKREKTIAGRDEKIKVAKTILRARMNFQGSMMTLQNQAGYEAQWRLFTSNDQEAISAFRISMSDNVEDAGRMARGLITRLKLGHWDTTMANAWGVTAMKKFSESYEKTPVTGLTLIEAEDVTAQVDWKKTPSGEKKLLNWPVESQGKEAAINFTQNGTGKPWMHVETSSAIPLKAPMSFGYTVKKVVTPVSQKNKGKWTIGDVVNVDLIVTASTSQTWVVLRDPLPSGTSHLGTGLSGESAMLNQASSEVKGDEKEWPVEYEQKSFSFLTRYAGYLNAGTYKTSYRYRINSSGNFKLPPTRVEAMYAPEVFGELPNAEFAVSN